MKLPTSRSSPLASGGAAVGRRSDARRRARALASIGVGRANGIATHFPTVTRGRWLTRLPRHGAALRSLLQEAWVEYQRDYARYFAVAMVYYALVSLVPLLLLTLAAFGWLLRLSPMAANA